MPSPFLGMDPYLEAPWFWPGFHQNLIVAIQDALAPQVAPAYYVAIEENTYIVRREEPDIRIRPDVVMYRGTTDEPRGGLATVVAGTAQTVVLPEYEEEREAYLEIRGVGTHEVVTVIELLSPTNKNPGSGRQDYEKKRGQILRAWTSLVEIDLLRVGAPMEMKPVPEEVYRIVVAVPWERPLARLYAFGLREPLPEIPVPLRQGEQEAVLSLGKLLGERYDAARYDLRLDYRQPVSDPPLPPEDAAWVEALLREKGFRPPAEDEREQATTGDPRPADPKTQGQNS